MTFECQNELVPRLVNKIKNHIDDISLTEEYDLDGADVIIIPMELRRVPYFLR